MDKIKLVENFNIDFGKSKLQENVEFLEKPKLIEGNNHKQFEARAIIRDIPVSRYTPNHNGRIYSEKLWTKVKESGLAEGSDCYGNHSENDDGNVFDSVGVWHNLRVGEKFPIADLYCIGEGGQLLAEKAKAGGKCGFSSVGYGEFLEDKMTVNPDTYELSHLCDWVVAPSQEVYATIENIKEDIEKNIKEDIEKSIKENTEDDKKVEKPIESFDTPITNKLTEKVDNSITEEKIKEDKFMEKFHEANLKNLVNAEIRKALKNPDIKEAIQTLKDIDTAEFAELTEKVNDAVVTLQNRLEEQKVNAEKALSEKTAQLEDMQKKFDETSKKMEVLEKNFTKVTSILQTLIKEQDVEDKSVSLDAADTNDLGKENYTDIENKTYNFKAADADPKGMKITTLPPNQVINDKGEDANKLGNEASSIIENAKKMKEDRKKLSEELTQLKEDRENMKSDIRALLEDRKTMISDIKQLIKDRKSMYEDLKNLAAKYNGLKKKIKEEGMYPDGEEEKKEEPVIEAEDENKVEPYEFSFDSVDNAGDMGMEAPEEKKEEEENGMESEEVSEEDDMVEVPEYDMMNAEVDKQVMEAEGEMEGKPEDTFDNILTNTDENETLEKPINEAEDEDEEEFEFEEEDMNMDSEEEKKEEPKQESKKVKPVMKESSIKSQVEEYFNAEVKFNSSLKDIKTKILVSKSLSEAVIKINKFKESIKSKKNETPVKFTESSNKKPDWLAGRL